MSGKTCKTCAIRYHDGFCMQHCYYTGDEQSCDLWSEEPLSFDYKRIYMLCEQYLKLCEDYKEHNELKEKYPEYNRDLSFMDNNYDFFFNCCLNDLHREMSLWRTRR